MGFLLAIMVIVYIFVCLGMILIILMQAGKGGGLSGLVGGSALSDTFGATGAQKALNKWTTAFAVIFIVFSIAITLVASQHFKGSSLLEQLAEEEAQATSPVSEPISIEDAAPPVEASQPADTGAQVAPEGEIVAPEIEAEVPEGEPSAPVVEEKSEAPAEETSPE